MKFHEFPGIFFAVGPAYLSWRSCGSWATSARERCGRYAFKLRVDEGLSHTRQTTGGLGVFRLRTSQSSPLLEIPSAGALFREFSAQAHSCLSMAGDHPAVGGVASVLLFLRPRLVRGFFFAPTSPRTRGLIRENGGIKTGRPTFYKQVKSPRLGHLKPSRFPLTTALDIQRPRV